MEEVFETKEWTYRLKGSRLKISFLARDEKTVQEYIRLVSELVDNPPEKLIKVKKTYIKKPPYPQEQEMLEWYRKCCLDKGIDPDSD